ncbi:MAG: RDD family protein [Mogibacterium sp.]|nr:RDD family protein [Mogibacterium sp.]
MKERKVMKLASRGKRLGAFCIDAVIPVVSGLIFTITILVLLFTVRARSGFPGYGFNSPYSEFGYGYGYGYSSGVPAGAVAAILISMILFIAYVVVQLVFYNKSKTIGKAVLGLQVVSSNNGEPIGFWKMLFREWFVKAASEAVFLLGYIWILVDDKNRGWHDKILDTFVVDLKESERLSMRSRRASKPSVSPAPKPAPAPDAALPAPENEPVLSEMVVQEEDTAPAEPAPAEPVPAESVSTEPVSAESAPADTAQDEQNESYDEKVVTDEQE